MNRCTARCPHSLNRAPIQLAADFFVGIRADEEAEEEREDSHDQPDDADHEGQREDHQAQRAERVVLRVMGDVTGPAGCIHRTASQASELACNKPQHGEDEVLRLRNAPRSREWIV